MAVSILHRVSGSGMAFVGLPLLLWWLGALASGPAAYDQFVSLAMTWFGLVVLFGVSWCFFNHLASGVRHFVMDMGAGYEVDSNRRWSVATMVLGVVLTVAFWAALLLV